MHSSRMGTVRSSSRLLGGVSLGVCQGSVCPGGVSQHALGQTPPCKQNDSQIGVKTLPFRNFVCGR